ncbi:unnamed protein product [Callosobruchus maculatus]|nr:unnamed protein product [Callosobruchus maculatus]
MIEEYGLILDTEWSAWSVCSNCGKIGRKHKLGYCTIFSKEYREVECPKEGVFEILDKEGKVIEKANNSAGIYSLMQELPPLEPDVERILIYAVKGKPIVLACPGNLNSDAPILWQIGDKNLVSELIAAESKGRIYVSISDKIYIKSAKIADSNVYSCWQQKELAGTIRLVVEKKFEMNFNHHIMLIGLVIILSVLLYVFVKAFFGRKYAKV